MNSVFIYLFHQIRGLRPLFQATTATILTSSSDIFVFRLVLPEGQAGDTWNLSKKEINFHCLTNALRASKIYHDSGGYLTASHREGSSSTPSQFMR